jgi:hypothetical protein
MTIHDVLRRVHHIFEEHDWCQGEYCDGMTGVVENDEFSLDGAILHVGEFHDHGEELAERVAAVVLEALGFSEASALGEDRMTTLARWNDSPERTVDDVKRAIEDSLALAVLA